MGRGYHDKIDASSAVVVETSLQLEYFESAFARDRSGCCAEPVSIMHMLKASFERDRRRGLLIDVGANVGNTVAAMIRIFGEQMLGYPHHSNDWQSGGCKNINGPLRLYAFEPNPEAFVQLQKRFDIDPEVGIVRMDQVAVSDQPGLKALFHIPGVDPMASFLVNQTKGAHRIDWVRLVTLDQYPGVEKSFVHLLKIDTEGYDPLVLRGASTLFSENRVKFVVFEYSFLWKGGGHSLQQVVTDLFSYGYLCFFILTVTLVPLSGHWWQRHYESYTWRNVFCGWGSDHDLFVAYVSYGVNRYTMSYALHNLQVIPATPINTSRECTRSLRC